MKREYIDYLNDMRDAAQKAAKFVEGIDFAAFEQNDEKQFAVIRALEVIGEAARAVPDEVRERYSGVPWREIIGMRDKLIHGYFGVDIRRVWETVLTDLPELQASVTKILIEAETDTDD